MYDITKAWMLLTTAGFAAVGALFAGGANARIPVDEGDSARGAQASIETVVDSRFAITESRAGSTRYGYVVRGALINPAQTSGQLSPVFYGIADTGVADDRVDIGVNFQYWGV